MAKYRVLELSYIGIHLVQEGDIVDYDGEPGSNLELVDEATAEGVVEKLEKAASKVKA